MAVFKWKGKNRYGDIVKGERRARSSEELSLVLQKEQIKVSEISKKRVELHIPFLEKRSVKPKELAIYSRQLSVLIDAELPLIQSLNILAEQTKNKYFKKVIENIREDVEAGSTLNQAKRKFPRVFDDLYCNLVASGEQSGSLDIMLRRLAEFLEKIVKLKSQVKQAMIYPASIVTFAIIVVIFMMWQVIPVFANIFTELGATLPGLTAFVLAVSYFVHSMTLKMPLFGSLLEKVGLSRITRTLSTLLSGGVPMLESLKVTSTTSGNVILEDHVMRSRSMVAEGTSLTDAFKEAGAFPFMMVQMVGVGEATGTLDEMLVKLADFYDEEVEASVAALLSVLEPVLLIFVGGLVGMIVVSMYLPIFSLLAEL